MRSKSAVTAEIGVKTAEFSASGGVAFRNFRGESRALPENWNCRLWHSHVGEVCMDHKETFLFLVFWSHYPERFVQFAAKSSRIPLQKRMTAMGRWPDNPRSTLIGFLLIFVLFPLLAWLCLWFTRY